MIQKQIIKLIEEYDTIIIHHHINPDPDCIGSQLGLKYMINHTYPNKLVYAVGNHAERTEFLGDLDDVSDDTYSEALVIIVDVGDKARIDDNRFLNGKALIKIDHHPQTEVFADIEWVDTSFASVTEMIIDLYLRSNKKLKMTEEAARVLYAGTLTDTGRFYHSNVTARSLKYGAELYQYNFDKQALYADIYYQSIEELKFKGYILNRFSHTTNGLGFMKLNDELLETFNIKPEYASSEVNVLANIKEIITWIFFIEYKETGKIRVEFRSRGPIVNGLAKKYGGGGHNWASGALVDSWEKVDNIIKDADEICFDFTHSGE
ncbi:bifunctional oligoribonuclease/PAP phosphatase NrnA [Mycoplasmatota bacterium]|nr:bifunctional oligoribonuclease/PAP phosphatase NrnA [Mycoplasmatota bacterium]